MLDEHQVLTEVLAGAQHYTVAHCPECGLSLMRDGDIYKCYKCDYINTIEAHDYFCKDKLKLELRAAIMVYRRYSGT